MRTHARALSALSLSLALSRALPRSLPYERLLLIGLIMRTDDEFQEFCKVKSAGLGKSQALLKKQSENMEAAPAEETAKAMAGMDVDLETAEDAGVGATPSVSAGLDSASIEQLLQLASRSDKGDRDFLQKLAGQPKKQTVANRSRSRSRSRPGTPAGPSQQQQG